MSSEDLKKYSPTDPELIDKIVNIIKSKGIFDQFRKDCLADVDTKPAYQNLQQRVNGTVTGFLATQKWQHGLNKTQLRESLRRHTVQQAFLEVGVDRIVDQVVNPKIFSVFMPKVEDVVCELLGIEKPKPKPLLLNFQKFKKSLEALPSTQPAPAPVVPTPEPIKEEPEEVEKTEEKPIIEPPPPEEKPPEPPQSSPTPSAKEEPTEVPKEDDPMSPAGSISEVVNNDDDSNTIDEMPLLAASLDSESDRGGSPVMDGAPQNNNTKIGAMSDMSDSNSLLSTRPPLEYDSSTNNLSSLKSEEKTSPSKKFDNFSNLGEKLKQADVNLRETSLTKKEEVMEENSDVTKSSENDTESSDMKIDLQSETNMSSTDAFRNEPAKIDEVNERIFSEDSQSSVHSFKNKSKLTESRDERSRSHKQEKKSSSRTSRNSKSAKADKKDESFDGFKETVKKVPSKESSSSKQHESKSKSKEDHKDKSRSSNDKDKHIDDKHRSIKGRSQSSDKHGKSDSSKDRKDKRERSENDDEKKNENPKVSDSNKHSEKKKKEEDRSKHHSRDSKDSKGHRKVDDHHKNANKDKNKTSDKEKNSEDQRKNDHDKSKKDSGGKSRSSKSDDKKHKDDNKKKDDDKKSNDDDKKKSPRKRKSGRCDEDETKSKNSRRSSDRDSNGNAGGGSSKSKSSNSSSHNGRKSLKSDKGRSHTKSKEQTDAMEEDCAMDLNAEVDEADEVDKILMEINNSIQNENQRLNISEVLNEPTVKKPKIARNFHEIKKIMQARKDIDRRISNDLMAFSSSQFESSVEEKVTSDVESHWNESYEEDLRNTGPDQDVSEVLNDSEECMDNVQSSESSEIVLKDCSIVVTDVLRGQLKDTSVSSLKNKRIILEDGAVKNIINYSPNSSESLIDQSDVNVSSVENLVRPPGDDSDSSFGLTTSVSAVKDKTDTKLLSENNIHSQIGERDLSPVLTSSNEEKEVDSSKTYQMGESEGHTEVPHSSSCSIPVHSQLGLHEEGQSQHLESTGISKVCVRPSCSSDILPIDGEDSDASIQTESGKASTANNATKENLDENSTDQSRSALPCRSKRSNAGTLMYAILENSKSPATVNRSSKRKGTRLETSQTLDGVCEAEVHNPVVKSNISQASENQNLAVEGPTKTCSNDEGSDVSNKENDETNVSCKTRSQLLDDGPREMKNVETRTTRRKDVGPNEVKPVETRTTRRKNLTNDLSEDLNKSAINNNVTRGRFEDVSLKCKNNRDAPKCFSEEMPGKVGIDVENKRRSTSVSIRHSSRKGVTPLYLRNAELEKGSCVNTSKDSSATNSLLDKPKFSEATCKSMESLHMDKENITVPPTTCGKSTTVDHCLNSSSQRRLSCPDIFETRETETIKIVSHEKISFSTQQEESSAVNSDFELHEDARRGDSQVNKTVADPGNNEKTNRRSGRLIGSTGHQDSLTIKDHGNGNRVSRHVRKFYHKLSKTETEISSNKKHEDLDPSNKTHTMCASKDSVNPSEDHTLIIPDLQHPSTITINIHSSVDKIVEDEPPQVTLFFDDSAVATFNSKDVQLKEHAVDDLSQIEYNIDSAEPSCLATKKTERSAKNSPLEELGRADSLLEDSCSSEFKGFSQEQPNATAQDSLEKEYKGFTDDEIQEATVKLRLLKQYIANKLQSPPADNLLDQIDGPPRIKKARVASEDVVSSNISKSSTDSTARQNPRKRNCSLNFSPEKDKKEVLGGQCKAESKDSGLCESPEQPSFVLDVYQNDAVMESGENSVRTRKKGNVPPATSTIGCTKNLRDDKCSDVRPKGYTKIRNPQRYSTNDLYKPRPVVSRDTRTSRSAPTTSRGRPKRST